MNSRGCTPFNLELLMLKLSNAWDRLADHRLFTVWIVQTSGGRRGAGASTERSGHGREAFAESVDRRFDVGVGVGQGRETGFEGRRC